MNIDENIFEQNTFDDRYLFDFAGVNNCMSSGETRVGYIILSPDTTNNETDTIFMPKRLKRLISCIFSFGLFRQYITQQPLSQSFRYPLCSAIVIFILAIIICIFTWIWSGSVSLTLMFGFIATSFCYASLQLILITFSRLHFYVEDITDMNEDLWPRHALKEWAFRDFYNILSKKRDNQFGVGISPLIGLKRKISLLKTLSCCNCEMIAHINSAIISHLKTFPAGSELFVVNNQQFSKCVTNYTNEIED